VTKEEETIIAEVVNVEESLLGGEEITTEETIVDADWLRRLSVVYWCDCFILTSI
jgi:hypothetical protein